MRVCFHNSISDFHAVISGFDSRFLAVTKGVVETAQIPGTTQDHLQIFNIELKSKVKAHMMLEQVCDAGRVFV